MTNNAAHKAYEEATQTLAFLERYAEAELDRSNESDEDAAAKLVSMLREVRRDVETIWRATHGADK